jgi:hypothetical protein
MILEAKFVVFLSNIKYFMQSEKPKTAIIVINSALQVLSIETFAKTFSTIV